MSMNSVCKAAQNDMCKIRTSTTKALPTAVAILIGVLCLTGCTTLTGGFFGHRNLRVIESPAFCETLSKSNKPTALKILFVGNSILYWHDVPRVFVSLAKRAAPERPLKIVAVMGDNYSLMDHLDAGTAVKVLKEQGPWDYVVLQGKSYDEFEPSNEEVIKKFIYEIVVAGAQPVLLQTYVHISDVPGSDVWFKYLASSLRIGVIPAGKAWNYARQHYPSVAIYDKNDHHHPSLKGTYLIACELFATFLPRSPFALPVNLDYEDAKDKTSRIFADPREADKLKEAVRQSFISDQVHH